MNRLYHVPLSPFCRKVRLTLAEKRIEVELVEERYWEQSPDFLRRNPAGKVPVLRMESRTLSESQAICEFLEEAVPEPRLMPRDVDGRYEVRRLCAWFDDKFHAEVTSKLLYERVNKKITGQGYPDSKNVKTGASRIKYHLDYLAWLLDQRRWLAGNEMTLADFTPLLRICRAWITSATWTGTGMRWSRTGMPRSSRGRVSGRCWPTRCRGSRRPRIMPTWISRPHPRGFHTPGPPWIFEDR